MRLWIRNQSSSDRSSSRTIVQDRSHDLLTKLNSTLPHHANYQRELAYRFLLRGNSPATVLDRTGILFGTSTPSDIDDNRLEEGASLNGQRVRFERACLYGIHVLQDDSDSNIVVIAVDFSKPSKSLQQEFCRVINRNTGRRRNLIHKDLNIEQFFRCYDLRKQHGLKMSWRQIAETVYGDPRCASQARSNYYKVTRRLKRLENHG